MARLVSEQVLGGGVSSKRKAQRAVASRLGVLDALSAADSKPPLPLLQRTGNFALEREI